MIVVAALALFVVGCNKDQAPSKPAAQKAVQKQAPQAPQAAQQGQGGQKAEKEIYVYEQKGRRDPFVSLVQVAKEKPKRLRGAKPTENFDVDEIRMIAILWDNKQYYALITLPDGKSYTIRKGTTLGLYGGKVEEITKDRVLVREQVKDYRGQLRTKDTILKLRKEGE